MSDISITEDIAEPGVRGLADDALLERSIKGFLWHGVRLSLRQPRRARFFAQAALYQRKATARRRYWAARGLQIPPLMMVSVTGRCNLHWEGCTIQTHARPEGGFLDEGELRRVLGEARDLGVSVVTLTGFEPSARPEILDIAGQHPELLFVVVTNGCLANEPILDKLERSRNIITVVRLEGFEVRTDGRRGDGVYARALQAMEGMNARGLFFGTSLTVTRKNFAWTTSRVFIRDLVERGSRLFFFADYVASEEGTEHLVPSERQRSAEALALDLFRSEFPGIFLASSAGGPSFGVRRTSLKQALGSASGNGFSAQGERLVA